MGSDETIEAEMEYQKGKEEVMGFGDRVLSVFMAPREAARSLARHPEWIRALVVVALVTAVASVLITRENAEFSREMMASASRLELTDEQLARMGEVTTKTFVSRGVGGVFWAGFSTLLYTLVLLLCGKATGGQAGFRRVFSMVSYSGLVGALGAAVMAAVVRLTGTFPVETSLGVLAGGSYWSLSRVALGNLEIFWLWQLVVLTLGLSVMQGFSVGKAAVSTVVLFVIRTLVLVGITAATRGFLGVAY
ncbi:MAG: YIP1 family protein [Candidatus Eisenbacteria sp.]|nr:YIP1 family protein [Candidatus Eisenbacteria bacterium]